MKTTLTVILIIQLYGLTSCAVKQHYYIKEKKRWDEAQQYCRTNYHNMSTFNSNTEVQKFLADAGNPSDHAWVGLFKGSGIWKWSDGEVATHIIWDDQQPKNDDCVFLNKDSKKLHDAKCTDSHHFFCMTFKFVMDQQTESWEGALDYCRNHYDDLATLSSKISMTYALTEIAGAQTQYVWIGLRFLAGEWFWLNGDDLQYQDWTDAKQPQCPAQNQRCGALDTNKKTWTNRDCEEKLNFLCSAIPVDNM